MGNGEGVWSWLHIEDAAIATVAAAEQGKPGIYLIANDQPLAMREWLPAFARWLVPSALVVTIFLFSGTDLRPGRWPYVVDWNAYARAVDVRNAKSAVMIRRGEEGVWAVAAGNPLVELDWRKDPNWPACPAFDTDAGAFFASLAGRMPAKLCGGVPVR